MKPQQTIFYLLFCIALSPLGYSHSDNLTLSIQKKIKAKGLKKSSLGLIISKKQKSGSTIPIYSLNEKQLFIPASLAKIAVLSALYHFYPPAYAFKTFFVSSAPLERGVLKGDLVLKGGGDSSFTSESLWVLANALTRSGLKEIQGDLLVDDSLYSKDLSGSFSERSYLAPASASSFNWNSAAFYIRPGKTLKSPAIVFADPASSYIEIINKAITGTKNKINIKRRSVSSKKEIFEIKGEVNIHEKEIVKYRHITQPALWLGHNALFFLKQRGITVSGQAKKGSCAGSCRALAEQNSRPFAFHSYNLMKYSSNFTAKMLVSHLPLLKGAKKGGLRKGMKWVNSYLKGAEGIKTFVLQEPSGLSRKNRLTPKDLQKILIRSQNKFHSAEALFSYPLAGGKGTLEKRFPALPPSSFVRAKTGSLSGALGLAGWASSKKAGDYVFVFIFNGKAGKSLKAQALFDEIILALLK